MDTHTNVTVHRKPTRAEVDAFFEELAGHRLDPPDNVEPEDWPDEFALGEFDLDEVLITDFGDLVAQIEISLDNGSRLSGWLDITDVYVDDAIPVQS